MALQIQITGSEFPPFGTTGESAGFTPLTPVQIEEGVKSSLMKFIVGTSVVVGQTTEDAAITEIVADTLTQATAQVGDLFTDGAAAYDCKVYILNVTRETLPNQSIDAADKGSQFVERSEFFEVSYRLEMHVDA